MTDKYRLVTRSDFDGLVCGALLKELDMIDDILFVHPKDMQDGKVDVSGRDITTNLPYAPGVYLAFDHHHSETLRNKPEDNHIIDPDAPSAARVVFDYFGGRDRFRTISDDLMAAVDKGDSAQFSRDEILHPAGWALLNFLMDARTGLGRFREFRISNYQLMMKLIDACREKTIDEILQMPDVAERVELYRAHESRAIEQLNRCSELHGDVVLVNLQNEDPIWATNRFTIYALYTDARVSIHRMWGLKKQNTVFAVGRSVLDPSNTVNIGELCLAYGGGGHSAAGTCQVDNDKADTVETELLEKLRQR